ncbi:hypothetical protein HF264_26660 [Rhizobium leguminosarum]|uniref:PD-(D/E)XK nuclease domain-containing protein n=1 Tax=Rhizobium leguminosarum TaxID=384 RepID=UPI001C91F4BB|nr:hypothetical protein [Rhizobium leguminosarum]MBY2943237.1 hypothetical protein [Rhizobium leguminosarum]
MNDRPTQSARALIAARARVQDCQIQIQNYAHSDEYLEHFDGREEMLEDLRRYLAGLVDQAIGATTVLFEVLGIPETLKSFQRGLDKFENQHSVIEYFDEFYGPHNPTVDYISSYLDLAAPLFEEASTTLELRNLLDRVLRGLGRYLEKQEKFPSRERDIQDALEEVLGLVFPDHIREAPIPKQTKNYFPDFAIDSISTAVEVKFAENSTEAKNAVGGLYEDMHGYANSAWNHFVGYIYMSGNYLTEDQVKAELLKANAPKEWRVILVTGHSKKTKQSEVKP